MFAPQDGNHGTQANTREGGVRRGGPTPAAHGGPIILNSFEHAFAPGVSNQWGAVRVFDEKQADTREWWAIVFRGSGNDA